MNEDPLLSSSDDSRILRGNGGGRESIFGARIPSDPLGPLSLSLSVDVSLLPY